MRLIRPTKKRSAPPAWVLMAAFVFAGVAARALPIEYWITSTNGNDSNSGTSSNSPWATFQNINLGTGLATPSIIHIGGSWNGALGSKYNVTYCPFSGTSNSPVVFTNWGPAYWTISNCTTYNAMRLSGLQWLRIYGGSFSSNVNTAVYWTDVGNTEFANCLVASNATSPNFTAYNSAGGGPCQSNWIHNCIFSNALAAGANCTDGGSDLLSVGAFFSTTDQSGYSIIESNQFYYNGHAGLEVCGPWNYISSNAFLNPPWYASATNFDCTNSYGFVTAGATWRGGRELSVGGGCATNTVVQDNRLDYCGYVPDQPGALHLENAGLTICRFNLVSCAAGVGIQINGEGSGGMAGSNAVYNNSIGMCGSNRTFYISGAEADAQYPEYQCPFLCASSSNNFFVNNVAWNNFFDYVSLPGAGTFANQIQWWAGNITNTDPGWASEANSIDVLNPAPPILPDFHVSARSPTVGGGTWPAVITAASGSGTSVTATNAFFLSAGLTASYRYIPGDTVQFQGTTQTAQILSIAGNVITFASSVTWTQGQGLALPYANAAPPMGTYDYGYGPTITAQPQSQTVSQGGGAAFTVTATDAPTTAPLYYQWSFNTAPIGGATATSYTVSDAQNVNAGNYQVLVTNAYGSAESAVAALNVGEAGLPTISLQPSNQVVNLGQTASFTVGATGTPPLTYQWYFNAAPVSGATTTSLTVANAQPGNAGNYDVVVANGSGNVVSTVVMLGVNYGRIMAGGNGGLNALGGTNILINGGAVAN